MEKENGNSAKPILPTVFVGQVLFREVSSRYTEGYITEHKVTKIGKKYFECEGLGDKITIATLRHENKGFSQVNYQLYRTKQEILDRNELNKLYNNIQKTFSHYNNHSKNFTLEQLRKVADIVGCR